MKEKILTRSRGAAERKKRRNRTHATHTSYAVSGSGFFFILSFSAAPRLRVRFFIRGSAPAFPGGRSA